MSIAYRRMVADADVAARDLVYLLVRLGIGDEWYKERKDRSWRNALKLKLAESNRSV